MSEGISKYVAELNLKLYGPKFCDHCQKVQPVVTYEKTGTNRMFSEGTKVTVEFVGAYACTVCHKTITTGSGRG